MSLSNTVHCTHESRAPPAHFSHLVCNIRVQHTSLTHQVCMNYTSRAVYTVSALTCALFTGNVHCQYTHDCTMHVQCTLSANTTLLCTRAEYTARQSPLHFRLALYTVCAITNSLTRGIIYCQSTHLCKVHLQCSLHTLISRVCAP